jgi:CRISPR/Cas system-associated exonuclease Cas4 (RecB family)
MPLSPDFRFSQSSLQDYVDCLRRFQLRYILELAWPAVAAEPADEYEAMVRDGEAFHRLVQQHVLGIVSDDVVLEPGSNLASWWANCLASPPPDLPPLRFPELTLSAGLGEHRLIAKFDLVAIEPGRRAVIVDWKTSAKRPRPGWLAARLQTRVYRYLLVMAGAALNGGEPLRPEQVEMIYWFAEHPDEPERLRYNATQFEADGRYLAELAAGAAAREDDVFPLTSDVKRCLFCAYRSLCNRGVEAGDVAGADEDAVADEEAAATDWAAGFDFEQVGEVEF